ncbi:CsgG/HfaB family protein, partial [bacterium]|nr:CsgG/HfaB family protein [bacterium]
MLKNILQYSMTIILILSGPVSAQNKSLVIMDFEASGVPPEEAKVFTEHLQVELFNRDLFTILEMPDVQKKLAERDFSLAKCSSAPCLAEAGKLSGTDLIIGGSITKIEDDFSVTVRMIDVKNGNVLKMFVYQHSGNIISLISDGVETIADKLSEPNKIPGGKRVVAQSGEVPANNSDNSLSSSKKVANPGGF